MNNKAILAFIGPIAFIGITEIAIASDARSLCKEAVYMAGGDGAFASGYCNNDNHSANWWQCVINGIRSSGKRGYSNDDVNDVISFGSGAGGC